MLKPYGENILIEPDTSGETTTASGIVITSTIGDLVKGKIVSFGDDVSGLEPGHYAHYSKDLSRPMAFEGKTYDVVIPAHIIATEHD